MQEITSIKNPAVQSAKALCTAKARKEQNAFLCDGEHMVSEALAVCPERVRALFIDKERAAGYAALLSKVPAAAAVFFVPTAVLETISQVKTPQGVAAVCQLPPSLPLAQQTGRLILLENVQDPGNVGTILRTLDAAGFSGCILSSGCADPYAPKTLRATMGSVFRIPLSFAEDGAAAARTLREQGYAVIGAELHGEPFYQRQQLPQKVCVLIGNEGAGLREDTLAQCTHRYKLPMRGGAESLNAAVAAAVMMYDIMNRQ
ncbi:MAG: RNA methyltransferase [Eubacteriales bacterium]|nr:RNA methyltransferase [Eubacteriales bacterium]